MVSCINILSVTGALGAVVLVAGTFLVGFMANWVDGTFKLGFDMVVLGTATFLLATEQMVLDILRLCWGLRISSRDTYR